MQTRVANSMSRESKDNSRNGAVSQRLQFQMGADRKQHVVLKIKQGGQLSVILFRFIKINK
uniref:Uncharacterized protein n=1 Tax=Rhizophora mucronata TaxID=61149 RepID=A0A2P2K3D4_RHIMU